MKFDKPHKIGTILKRYKRFLADIELENGEEITVHVPNTGSMKSCWEPGWKAYISDSENPNRKYRYTLDMLHNGETWIGVNTSRPNFLVMEAIKNDVIPELSGYEIHRSEVKYGKNSRIDILLENENSERKCFIEIKNTTLRIDDTVQFPDAVSDRGLKHILELEDMMKDGHRAVMFYLVQREDVNVFKPAAHIDPKYADALTSASSKGLEILVYQCHLNEHEIRIDRSLPFNL